MTARQKKCNLKRHVSINYTKAIETQILSKLETSPTIYNTNSSCSCCLFFVSAQRDGDKTKRLFMVDLPGYEPISTVATSSKITTFLSHFITGFSSIRATSSANIHSVIGNMLRLSNNINILCTITDSIPSTSCVPQLCQLCEMIYYYLKKKIDNKQKLKLAQHASETVLSPAISSNTKFRVFNDKTDVESLTTLSSAQQKCSYHLSSIIATRSLEHLNLDNCSIQFKFIGKWILVNLKYLSLTNILIHHITYLEIYPPVQTHQNI